MRQRRSGDGNEGVRLRLCRSLNECGGGGGDQPLKNLVLAL